MCIFVGVWVWIGTIHKCEHACGSQRTILAVIHLKHYPLSDFLIFETGSLPGLELTA